jgi:outer membrane protein OmpA-like peptidoglycan-associated protein
MKSLFKSVLLGGLLLVTSMGFAQDFLGYSASEYAGVTAIDIQPANLADNRFKFDMTLFGTHVKAYNNYVGVNRSKIVSKDGKFYGSLIKSLKGDTNTAWSDPNFKDNYLVPTDSRDNQKRVYFANRIVLPSFLVEINHKNTIAFTWDIRNYTNVDGISRDLARMLYRDLKDSSNWAKKLDATNVSLQAMSWAEYGVTYARVLKEDNQHAFKVAGRLKIMQGIAAAYMFAKDFNYKFERLDTMFVSGSDTVRINDEVLSVANVDVDYGHSANLYTDDVGGLKYDWKQANPGFGLDLGFVYEYRPEYKSFTYEMDNEQNLWRRDKSKYKFKLGASILDIGGIKFKKGQYSNNFKANVNLWDIRNLKFDSVPVKAFDDTLINRFGISSNSKTTFFMNLPTALSVQADYKVWKDFDINMVIYYALQFKNNAHKVHDYTSISITPAYDHKWFGIFLPVQYHALFGMTYGACARIGPIIVGTDNLGSIINKKKNFYGSDVYFLLKIPIPFAAPKDKDKDKISNKKDKCKDVAGVWEFMGCPDTDGDHIPDAEDKCPTVFGIKEMNGCPDKDGDKITDADDMCPDDAGLIEYRGCPDRDGDKIIDKEDECPDEVGPLEFMGCPDKDADGTPDKMDACPDVWGPKEFKGCPDKDGDGVLDKDDACIDLAGVAENKGCPWPDTDKDGIFDKDDDCPAVFGVKENKGCPVIPAPVLKEEEKKVLEQAFANLEFATGKDIIKPTSFKSLDDLAKLLKEHSKDWMLNLDGHTDNQGDPAKNMILSEKRAKAVAKYLTKKGVKADKFKVEWHGPNKPIADNTTKEGQQKNRRVEMKIIFK